ncbi:YdcF family protein [Caulobacter sp. 73W]|uniref:YdcF family protein n=1 Tax=Caulobacter sp. 73W TaxID=3161137 RepID=A0AB39KVF9_9CAUL
MKTIAALLIALMIWGVGLLTFVARIDMSTPAQIPPTSEGIVVLTGASNARLEEGMRLLEEGKGDRLLVSGVNREATRADIQDVTGATKGLYDCCVDLGFTAADTVGNGRETAEWARNLGYKSVIVVTADYHMPRAMIELRSAMPEAEFHAYPIKTDAVDARSWWKTAGGAKRMAFEYCKYLAILGREAFLKLGPDQERKG